MKKTILIIISIFFSFTAYAEMSDANKSKAWDCSGIYMANYFLPSGETFEYSMKEKSMASVKVLKAYALETGIPEKNWDEGVNKAVDEKNILIIINIILFIFFFLFTSIYTYQTFDLLKLKILVL